MTDIFPGQIAVSNPLAAVISRLTVVLKRENEVLESAKNADHAEFIVAKNQALRELMVLQRTEKGISETTAMTESLRDVRKLVERNSQLLKLQVSALNDITSFLTQSMILEQGDGTYTREQA
jgi:hypothetical protein